MRIKTYTLLFTLGILPIIAMALLAEILGQSAVEEAAVSGNRAAAQIARELVESEFQHQVSMTESFSRLPVIRQVVTAQDEDGARQRLQILVETQPRVGRAFLTDKAGNLWSDFPVAPDSLKKNFSDRDWYKGVSASWQPYVSRVYRRNAAPRELVVAVAMPVRRPGTEEVSGILVCQVRLEEITKLLRRIEVGEGGYVYLLDNAGNVAAHPELDLQAREYHEYADAGVQQFPDNAVNASTEYGDPFAERDMLATAMVARVTGAAWTVVAQQPSDLAFARVRVLGLQIAVAGLAVSIVALGLMLWLGRFHVGLRTLNDTLRGRNTQLARDVDSHKRSEEALQFTKKELEQTVEEKTRELRQKDEQLLHAQKMEAVGKLAGGVAHDFNNLLSVIIGYSELLLLKLPEGNPARKEVEEIAQAGERAATLTRQLLAFSRKQVMQPQLVNLNEVVGRMDKMLRRMIGEDIDLVSSLQPGLHNVKVDPGQMEQILMNLAVNARDAMPAGGKLTIETHDTELDENYARSHADARVGPHVLLAVTDTGTGMTPDVQARIFEPFFTTKEMGRGTGLGLSTVYGIVKQSGGNIWVYSEPGHGTTFKVYLPRAQATGEVSPPAAVAAPQLRGQGTVLIVEDEEGVRALAKDVLESAGYTVLAAPDGPAAVQAAAAHAGTIDLMLTDVVLPGMGGPQVAREVAARRPGLKVLFMSGYTDNAIVHHGVLDPGTAFLEKPIRPQQLLQKVREVLG